MSECVYDGVLNFTADQRYYASAYGRFNTVDPSRNSVHPKNPGSWNRYAYTRGDPVNRNDPGGLADSATDSDEICDDDAVACSIYEQNSEGDDGDGGDDSGDPSQVIFQVDSCTSSQVWDNDSQTCVAMPQNFNQCMAENGNTFSAPGLLQQIVNGLSGGNSQAIQNNGLLQFVYGNFITGLLWGSPGEAAGGATSLVPPLIQKSIGRPLTFGRRTSSIMSLNIIGKGGLPNTLKPAAGSVSKALGTLGDILGGGIGLEVTLPMNLILAAAETAYCVAQP